MVTLLLLLSAGEKQLCSSRPNDAMTVAAIDQRNGWTHKVHLKEVHRAREGIVNTQRAKSSQVSSEVIKRGIIHFENLDWLGIAAGLITVCTLDPFPKWSSLALFVQKISFGPETLLYNVTPDQLCAHTYKIRTEPSCTPSCDREYVRCYTNTDIVCLLVQKTRYSRVDTQLWGWSRWINI